MTSVQLFEACRSRSGCQVDEVERVLMACKRQHDLDILVTSRDGDGYSVLTHACLKNCDEGVLRCLVVAGAKLTAVEPNGLRVLHTVVHHQLPGPIKELLELGCDWRAGERTFADPALWHAIKRPPFGCDGPKLRRCCIEALVRHCPDGEASAVLDKRPAACEGGEKGECALHVAAAAGDREILALLVNLTKRNTPEGPKTVDLDVRDGRGHSPLWVAASKGRVECCTLLLQLGAKVDACGVEGSTPLRVAARKGGVGKTPDPSLAKVVALLLAHGASAYAASLSEAETVAAMQKALVAATPEQMSVLAGRGRSKPIGGVAFQGSAMNAQHPTHGRTALHEAALKGRPDAVQLLVSQGADINLRDRAGMTALELAAYFEEEVNDSDDDEDGEEEGQKEDGGHKKRQERWQQRGSESKAKKEGGRHEMQHGRRDHQSAKNLLAMASNGSSSSSSSSGDASKQSLTMVLKAAKEVNGGNKNASALDSRSQTNKNVIDEDGQDDQRRRRAPAAAAAAAASSSSSSLRGTGVKAVGRDALRRELKKEARVEGREEVQCLLIGLGCELGTQAQAERLAWVAAFNGSHRVLKALSAHPLPSQPCSGPLGRLVLCAHAQRPTGPQQVKDDPPQAHARGAGPRFHGCPALWAASHQGHLECVRELLKAGADPNAAHVLTGPLGRYQSGTWVSGVVPLKGHKGNLMTRRGSTGEDAGRKRVNLGLEAATLLRGTELLVRGVQKVRPAYVPSPDGTAPLHQAAMLGHLDILHLLLGWGRGGSKLVQRKTSHGDGNGHSQGKTAAARVVEANKRVALDPRPESTQMTSTSSSSSQQQSRPGSGGTSASTLSSRDGGSGSRDSGKKQPEQRGLHSGGGEGSGGAGGTGEFEGCTALHLACLFGQPQVCAVLLGQKGVEVDSLDSLGRTPLLCLCETSAEALASSNNDPRTTTARHPTDRSRVDANEQLNGKSASPPPPPSTAPSSSSSSAFNEISSLLLSHGASSTRKDWIGRTAVQLAAAKDRSLVLVEGSGGRSSERNAAQQQQQQPQPQQRSDKPDSKGTSKPPVPPIQGMAELLSPRAPSAAPPPQARLDLKAYQEWVQQNQNQARH